MMKNLNLKYFIVLSCFFYNFTYSQTITLQNPSFEFVIVGSGWTPPNWTNCNMSVWQIGVGTFPWSAPNPDPLASEGNTYLRLLAGKPEDVNGAVVSDTVGSASALMSTPTIIGTEYSFSMDVMPGSNGNTVETLVNNLHPPILNIFLTNNECQLGQLIYSDTLTNTGAWESKNVTFTPNDSYPYFTIVCNSTVMNDNGDYAVAYVDNISDIVPSAISNIQEKDQPTINIYPNPSKGQFQISNAGYSAFEVYNATGELILNDKANSNQYLLDLSNEPNGIYLVKFYFENEIITKKVSLKK